MRRDTVMRLCAAMVAVAAVRSVGACSGGSGGCRTDSDCKGNRICDSGACVSVSGGAGGLGGSGAGPGPVTTGVGPATTGVGPTSTGSSSCSFSVPPGDPCTTDCDCDMSACDSQSLCVDWHDGNGPICSCTCSWGTECQSGCCWSVDNGAELACRDGSACVGIGGQCSFQYECLNNNCGAFKTHCYEFSDTSGGVCGCECNQDSDCSSGCCSNYGSYDACADPNSFQCGF